MIAKKDHKHVTVEMKNGEQKINYLETENPYKFTKGYQYIMHHDKVIFSSPDKVSISMLWNNITGKNFEGKDILGKQQTKTQHLNYLEMMRLTAGLPAGYIQLYLKPGVMAEEYLVPDATTSEGTKAGIRNQGRTIFFEDALKFSDVFTENTKGVYIRGLNSRFELTPKAKEAADNWHVAKWGNTYYFDIKDYENGFSIIYIHANSLIASSVYAVIENNSIPKGLIQEEEEEEETISDPEQIETPVKENNTTKLTAKEVFAMCSITDDHIVKLPNIQLDRKVYSDVKTIIEKNGGRWKGGKTQGFQFEFNPTDLFTKLHGGEDVNNKKDFQFFATPDEVINLMLTKASIQLTDNILEPSAGQGAIVDRIISLCNRVDMCEFMSENRQILENKGYKNRIICEDFTKLNFDYKYDKILANPPFTKNQDIDHVLKMYEHLKPGGRIVTIMGPSWVKGSQKKQVNFKSWLAKLGATYEPIEEGAFKKSGTGIKTYIVVIDKK